MRRTYTESNVHLVRLHVGPATFDDRRHGTEGAVAMAGPKCRELGAEPLAIGGTDDHVHLLASGCTGGRRTCQGSQGQFFVTPGYPRGRS